MTAVESETSRAIRIARALSGIAVTACDGDVGLATSTLVGALIIVASSQPALTGEILTAVVAGLQAAGPGVEPAGSGAVTR